MERIRVDSLMTAPVITIEADHPVSLAVGIMNLKRVRHLPVVQGGVLIGLVSHRDLMAAQAAMLASPDNISIPVGDIMQTEVTTVAPETALLDAARLMLANRYGCLPVVDGTHLVGIVTASDLLQLLVAALERRREQEDTSPGVRHGKGA